jgi:hypothetical protein
MKRWMIEWQPEHRDREPLLFEDLAAADEACALIVAGLPSTELPRPVVIEVVAGVLDNLQSDTLQSDTLQSDDTR